MILTQPLFFKRITFLKRDTFKEKRLNINIVVHIYVNNSKLTQTINYRKMKSVLHSLLHSQVELNPFRHWLLRDFFSISIYDNLVALPLTPPDRYDSDGKRSGSKNPFFFNKETCVKFDVCDEVVAIFQAKKVVSTLEKLCSINLHGSYLRIGYYVDKEGFWLEPHTDLSVKLITMTVYLSKEIPSEDIGTDLFDIDKRKISTVPSENNNGLIFLPAENTWHGLNRKSFTGLRKILIINYVTEDWLSRQELCYPAIF